MLPRLKNYLAQESLFFIALGLALMTSLLSTPRLAAVDWKVILSLFNLMAVLQGLESLRLLDAISLRLLARYRLKRRVSLVLICLSFVSSMLITNDVALLTLVPMTMIIARKAEFDPWLVVILETLAANLGSSLTPMGNPQNLFLYSFYRVPTGAFVMTMAPLVLLGGLWLYLLNLRNDRTALEFQVEQVKIEDNKRLCGYLALFFLVVLSIVRVVPYQVAFLTTCAVLACFNRELYSKVDYHLLGTFVGLFIFIDNITRIPAVTAYMQGLLQTSSSTYLAGALLSQLISNVPATILLAGFTSHWRALLLGANVGGMGTMIASLASLIAYKIYSRSFPPRNFMVHFHLYNLLSLCALGGIVLFAIL